MAITVLIVDDSATMIMSLKSALSIGGFQVETANNGQAALDKLKAGLKPDLILTDINMPVMGGLELIQKVQTYTMSYFPDQYRKQMLFLGSKSGRDTEKMKEAELTIVQTLSGNMSFKEARLIIECTLTAITTPNPDDFATQEAKDYINEAYKEASDYRKFVFGEITHIWERL